MNKKIFLVGCERTNIFGIGALFYFTIFIPQSAGQRYTSNCRKGAFRNSVTSNEILSSDLVATKRKVWIRILHVHFNEQNDSPIILVSCRMNRIHGNWFTRNGPEKRAFLGRGWGISGGKHVTGAQPPTRRQTPILKHLRQCNSKWRSSIGCQIIFKSILCLGYQFSQWGFNIPRYLMSLKAENSSLKQIMLQKGACELGHQTASFDGG